MEAISRKSCIQELKGIILIKSSNTQLKYESFKDTCDHFLLFKGCFNCYLNTSIHFHLNFLKIIIITVVEFFQLRKTEKIPINVTVFYGCFCSSGFTEIVSSEEIKISNE